MDLDINYIYTDNLQPEYRVLKHAGTGKSLVHKKGFPSGKQLWQSLRSKPVLQTHLKACQLVSCSYFRVGPKRRQLDVAHWIQAEVKMTEQNLCLSQTLTSLSCILKLLSNFSFQESVQCSGNIPAFHAGYLWVPLHFPTQEKTFLVNPVVPQLSPYEEEEVKLLKIIFSFPTCYNLPGSYQPPCSASHWQRE